MSANVALIEPAAAPVSAPASTVADPLAIVARLAENPNVDPDKLLRLYELAERARAARGKEAFASAIAAAKGEIGPIFKNKTVDFTSQKGRTNYRHEDFAEVARTVDPVLSRHGISYRYRTAQDGNKLRVTCIVSHADGYSEETTLEANDDMSGNKNSIQAVGSAATYLQRYTIKLALGLAATTDDDARQAAPQEIGPIDADQVAFVEQQLRDTASDRSVFLKYVGAESVEAMTVPQYQKALAAFAAKKKGAGK